jgi:hypothetical protein
MASESKPSTREIAVMSANRRAWLSVRWIADAGIRHKVRTFLWTIVGSSLPGAVTGIVVVKFSPKSVETVPARLSNWIAPQFEPCGTSSLRRACEFPGGPNDSTEAGTLVDSSIGNPPEIPRTALQSVGIDVRSRRSSVPRAASPPNRLFARVTSPDGAVVGAASIRIGLMNTLAGHS